MWNEVGEWMAWNEGGEWVAGNEEGERAAWKEAVVGASLVCFPTDDAGCPSRRKP